MLNNINSSNPLPLRPSLTQLLLIVVHFGTALGAKSIRATSHTKMVPETVPWTVEVLVSTAVGHMTSSLAGGLHIERSHVDRTHSSTNADD